MPTIHKEVHRQFPPTSHKLTMNTWVALSLLLLVVDWTARAQMVKPCPSPQLALAADTHDRLQVQGDYLVVEYNAASRQTFWYDYHHRLEPYRQIDRNTTFLPVVYYREKIAVHVCGLHFADQLTVTTNPVGLAEGGADIHGVTPTTLIPTLTPVLDTLQSLAPTGGQATEAGLGFAKTADLGSTVITGITRGSDGKTSYSDASISYSGEQIARMMYAVIRNGDALTQTLNDLQNDMPPVPKSTLPGKPSNLVRQADNLRQKITHHSEDITDAAAFDEDLISVQSLVAQLNTLSGALAAQAFGARAATLQNSFNTLRGILDLVGVDNKGNSTCDKSCNSAFDKFKKNYGKEVSNLVTDPAGGEHEEAIAKFNKWEPATMFNALDRLKSQLEQLDETTGDIFNLMNSWNRKSDMEQTDLLAPATGNALMRISIIVQRGYTPFTLTANPSPTASAAPAANPSATTSTPAHAVKTILVEVHRRANFNAAGGVMLVHVPSSTFSVTPALNATPSSSGTSTVSGGTTATTLQTYTATCNGGAPATITTATYSCVVTTQSSPWQVGGMAGIVWYPFGHDYFPRGSGLTGYSRNYLPSLLLGTSVTSFGSAVGALNFEPVTGINLFAGVGSAHSEALPDGVSAGTVLAPGTTLTPVLHLKYGFTTGIAVDLGIFAQIFKTATAVGLP